MGKLFYIKFNGYVHLADTYKYTLCMGTPPDGHENISMLTEGIDFLCISCVNILKNKFDQ